MPSDVVEKPLLIVEQQQSVAKIRISDKSKSISAQECGQQHLNAMNVLRLPCKMHFKKNSSEWGMYALYVLFVLHTDSDYDENMGFSYCGFDFQWRHDDLNTFHGK